jgi:hypothetical protein
MISSVAAEWPATALSFEVSYTRTHRNGMCTSFDLSRDMAESSRTCAGPNARLSMRRWARCGAPSATRTPQPRARRRNRRTNRLSSNVVECAGTCWRARRLVVTAVRCCAPQAVSARAGQRGDRHAEERMVHEDVIELRETARLERAVVVLLEHAGPAPEPALGREGQAGDGVERCAGEEDAVGGLEHDRAERAGCSERECRRSLAVEREREVDHAEEKR